jgi:hypothetical protein
MGGFEGDGDLSPDGDPSSPDSFSYPLDYVEALPDSLDLTIPDLALTVKVPTIPAPTVGVVGEALPDSLDLTIPDLALTVKVPAIPDPAVGVVGEALPDSLDLPIPDLTLAVKVPAIPGPAVGVVGEALPDSLDLPIFDLALTVKVPTIPAPAVGVVGEALPDSLDLTTPVIALVFGVVENIAVTPALGTSSLASSTEVLVFENNALVIRGCINAVDVIKAVPSAPTFEVEDGDHLLLGQGFDDSTENDEEGQKRRALLTATVGTFPASLPTDKTTIVTGNTAGNRIAGKRKRAPSPPLRPAVKTMSTVTSTTKKRSTKVSLLKTKGKNTIKDSRPMTENN